MKNELGLWLSVGWFTLGGLSGFFGGVWLGETETQKRFGSERATKLDACQVLLDETGVELVRLEKVIDGRLNCRVEECADDFEKWKEGQEYPCPLLKLDNRELRLALDRKCDATEGALADCKRNLREVESQAAYERSRVEECDDMLGEPAP